MTTEQSTTEEMAPPVQLRPAGGTRAPRAVRTPAASSSTASPPHIAAATAESAIVSMRVVRKVGAETALVLALIQAGIQDYANLARATGLRQSNVRIHWAKLSRYGYQLPDHQTALGAAASAPSGADTH